MAIGSRRRPEWTQRDHRGEAESVTCRPARRSNTKNLHRGRNAGHGFVDGVENPAPASPSGNDSSPPVPTISGDSQSTPATTRPRKAEGCSAAISPNRWFTDTVSSTVMSRSANPSVTVEHGRDPAEGEALRCSRPRTCSLVATVAARRADKLRRSRPLADGAGEMSNTSRRRRTRHRDRHRAAGRPRPPPERNRPRRHLKRAAAPPARQMRGRSAISSSERPEARRLGPADHDPLAPGIAPWHVRGGARPSRPERDPTQRRAPCRRSPAHASTRGSRRSASASTKRMASAVPTDGRLPMVRSAAAAFVRR